MSAKTDLHKLVFDDAQLCTVEFAHMLQNLLQLSGDPLVYYIVLRPDPVAYFYHHFGKYPCLEISPGDVPDNYLAALNEDPGGSPADAIGTNWLLSAIVPAAANWFCHLQRAAGDDGGHLWVPEKWTHSMIEKHRFLREKAELG